MINDNQAKFTTVEGGKLAYWVQGSGPVVLCLPGMGDSHDEYDKLAPALAAAGYRVFTTDIRGIGLSEGKFKTHNLRDLTNDIGAILDAEGVDKAFIVACSISGASAGQFAGEQPQRVLGFVGLNPIFYSPSKFNLWMLSTMLRLPGIGRSFWTSYFKSLYPAHPVEAEYLANMTNNLKKPGGMKSLADMAGTEHLTEEQVSTIKAPALIFLGTKDPDFKDVDAEAAKIKGNMPQAQIEKLEGLGHYPQREAPEMVIPQIVEWLAARR